MARKEEVRTLWDRDFRLVKLGLDEGQVAEFVQELMAKLKEAQEETDRPPEASSVYALAERMLREAENLVGKLEEEAKQIRVEAQAEADRMIEEAQRSLQDQADSIGRVARTAAEEAQKVVRAAREDAALVEAESRRRAEQLIDHTKKELEGKVRRSITGASEKLLPYLEDVVREVQRLRVDMENWEAPISERTQPFPGTASQRSPTVPRAEPAKDAAPASNEQADTADHGAAVHLDIQAPVQPRSLAELYHYLGGLSDVTVMDMRQVGNGGYVIDLSVENPASLLNTIKGLESVSEAREGTPSNGDDPSGRILVKLREQP